MTTAHAPERTPVDERVRAPGHTSFGGYVRAAAAAGHLVVQPRMGFASAARMREGLRAVRGAHATTAGTITVDSYTRVGAHAAAGTALADGSPLNGYPIVAHPTERTRGVLDGIAGGDFPVQVRHGSADPRLIIRALAAAGLHATEGGPVSYCLPYGRTPLHTAIDDWARGCELLASLTPDPHLESFGGCLLGQLCPPALLVAVSVLEAMFFTRHGIRSVSLSYTQQTHPGQDAEALRALRTLAGERLPAGTDWHVVLYTYMGVYPSTPTGAARLLADSARLAAESGAERLVVKTTAESARIPTIAENVRALELAACAAESTARVESAADTGVLAQARALVDAVLDLDDDIGRALRTAFARGVLDIPFCLHPDNAGRASAAIDHDGRLRWTRVGGMPLAAETHAPTTAMTAAGLLTALRHVATRYDSRTKEAR